MENINLLSKIAHLETVNDQLEAELVYMDAMMRKLGFTHGLETVKATASEILRGSGKSQKKKSV